jgi:hypothetical protein
MTTTIQVNERTILLLKKLKEELNASSYDEAIQKITSIRNKKNSLAGNLKKYYNKEKISEVLSKIREKNDRI